MLMFLGLVGRAVVGRVVYCVLLACSCSCSPVSCKAGGIVVSTKNKVDF